MDFAVLECARGGILKAGLGFHNCDISIVTNVAADHLGLKDINTIEEMALAAISKGYQYLVISDHSKSAFYDNGLH